MQDKLKIVKNKKKKRTLVYKPYQKGKPFSKDVLRRSLRIFAYFFLFLFIYFLLGASLQFDNTPLRIAANLLLVAVCGMLLYVDGSKQGEGDVALGETTLSQLQANRKVSQAEIDRCYHPLKSIVVALIGCLPILLISIPFAVTAEKPVYMLQPLPGWMQDVGKGYVDVSLPLSYYQTGGSISAMDIIHMIVRAMALPFFSIASGFGVDAELLVSRLTPLLVCLPVIGYPIGYFSGPKARALVHGDINRSNKRHARKNRKAVRARKERTQKSNQII